MSLITRCPACQTSFKVVPDQLRISEGWVRCGQCQQIFDASAALADDARPPEPVRHEPVQPETGIANDHKENPVEEPAVAGSGSFREPIEQAADLTLSFGAVDTPDDRGSEPLSTVTSVETASVKRQVSDEAKASAQPGAGLSGQQAHEALVKAAMQDVSFMRSMPVQPSWQRATARGLLALAALVLAAALGLQAALHERDRIAALFPQAKPALIWLCGQLDCRVSDFRHIESVVIDSSSFNKVRADVYRLALSVRNTSTLDIAMPALELTLTDSQDQALLRKVFQANEFTNSSTLGAASDWTGAIAISVRTGDAAERFTGYRVLAFYP